MSLQYCTIRFESKYLLYLVWEAGFFAVPPHLFRDDTELLFSMCVELQMDVSFWVLLSSHQNTELHEAMIV